MAHQQSAPSPSLCSWPPSPSLLQLHLLARGVLVLNNIIGLSLLFAVGTDGYGDEPSAIVGGSFLTTSLAVTPLVMLWNRKLLKRVRKQNGPYQQLSDGDDQMPRIKVKALKLVTSLDALGAVAFFSVFFPCILEASNPEWWRSDSQYFVTYSYGTVALLVAS